MTTSSSGPPTFSDSDKFDGTNWVSFKNMVTIAAEVRGVMGYLTGDIRDPSTLIKSSLDTTEASSLKPASTAEPEDTPWDSETPTASEWRKRNAWAKGLLIYNIQNPIGLGANIAGTAAEVWKSLTELYDKTSELARLHAEERLRSLRFRDGEDFPTHIAQLRTLWQKVNSMGGSITDTSFRSIILGSLPETWDPIVATLYTTTSSVDALTQLNAHWSRVSSRDRRNPSSNAPAVLQVSGPNRIYCTNPNCRCPGHTIKDCYWKGGGKEGKFPPNFGRRRQQQQQNQNHQTYQQNHTNQSTQPPPRSYNVVVNNQGQANQEQAVIKRDREAYVLMADAGTHARIPLSEVTTIVDSGATDHCFVNREDFTQYTQFKNPMTGQTAEKDVTFEIIGQGTVMLSVDVGGKVVDLTLNDVLHTPGLRSNLISIPKICSLGFSVFFGLEEVAVRHPNGAMVLRGIMTEGLYQVPVVISPKAYLARSQRKPASFDVWHRRFGHAGADSLKNLARKGLVDGLDVVGGMEMGGNCEDCIYGKMHARPYDEEVVPERELLECLHIDLWGPSPVTSAGGSRYFMLMMDGASSFRAVEFLREKTLKRP